jgi:hypothetical protein
MKINGQDLPKNRDFSADKRELGKASCHKMLFAYHRPLCASSSRSTTFCSLLISPLASSWPTVAAISSMVDRENSSNSRARAFEDAKRAFEVWLVSVRMTKLRLSPTTMHAEIVRGWNTIFCGH